jgi:hypothetical protein
MKIQGGNNGNRPIDFNQIKNEKIEKSESPVTSTKGDSVDAKLSAALNFITSAISDSGLTAGQIHSNVDESRLENVLENLERVEAKRPQYDSQRILELSDRVVQAMANDSSGALAAFKTPDVARVADLLS